MTALLISSIILSFICTCAVFASNIRRSHWWSWVVSAAESWPRLTDLVLTIGSETRGPINAKSASTWPVRCPLSLSLFLLPLLSNIPVPSWNTNAVISSVQSKNYAHSRRFRGYQVDLRAFSTPKRTLLSAVLLKHTTQRLGTVVGKTRAQKYWWNGTLSWQACGYKRTSSIISTNSKHSSSFSRLLLCFIVSRLLERRDFFLPWMDFLSTNKKQRGEA